MDTIRRWNEGRKVDSEKFKTLQKDFRMQKMLEQRQKSGDERELERIMEKKRQEKIKNVLKKIRKQETKNFWKGNMFSGKATITRTDKPILKEKNIFLDHKSNFPITRQEAMFFK